MSKPRGNKTSAVTRERRREKALDVLRENPKTSQEQIADLVGVSRTTLWRYMSDLKERLAQMNLSEFETRIAAQEAVLELIEKSLIEDEIAPDVANAWRQVRKDIAELRGLNAPSRAVVAHTSTSGDVTFLKFKKSVSGLSETQLEEAFTYLAKLPREVQPVVKDASWFPPQKQLSGGGDVESA